MIISMRESKIALLALHSGNKAKPQEPGWFLKLLLKSKEQKEQIKYLDLLILRILYSSPLRPPSPRGSGW